MNLPTVVQIAREYCEFLRYQDGALWYRCTYFFEETAEGVFDFPIPVSDAGGGSFLPRMKGLELLRWARKHLEFLENAMADNQ